MVGRDIPQTISVIVILLTLGVVTYKSFKMRRVSLLWVPLIIISLVTLLYYVLVFIDSYIDIINASNLSAFLRLSVQIMLLLYAWYMPPRRDK